MVEHIRLNSSSLRRATAIMRQWSYVDNFNNLNTCTMTCTNSRFTAITGTFYISLNLAES